jgi:hypothetical protein
MTQNNQLTTLQGVQVPSTAVDPTAFFKGTRRQNLPIVRNKPWAGIGANDVVTAFKTGIFSALTVSLRGQVIVPAATSYSTGRWPHDLIRKLTFAANGQSNLIACSGAKLKMLEFANHHDLNDRGISFASSGVTFTQGSLLLSSDTPGFGNNAVIAAGTYDFQMTWEVPVAWDRERLIGAVFAQTAGTDLTVSIDWANMTEIFSTHGTIVAPTFQNTVFSVDAEVFTIPEVGGIAVVPDLSTYHQIIQSRDIPAVGINETRVPGQGIGRQLMRLGGQVWLNEKISAGNQLRPVPMRAQIGATPGTYAGFEYIFAGNTSPEPRTEQLMRRRNEQSYGSRIGDPHGFWMYDFQEFGAFRDSLDMGAASELRIKYELLPTAISGAQILDSVELFTETLFSSQVGA